MVDDEWLMVVWCLHVLKPHVPKMGGTPKLMVVETPIKMGMITRGSPVARSRALKLPRLRGEEGNVATQQLPGTG